MDAKFVKWVPAPIVNRQPGFASFIGGSRLSIDIEARKTLGPDVDYVTLWWFEDERVIAVVPAKRSEEGALQLSIRWAGGVRRLGGHVHCPGFMKMIGLKGCSNLPQRMPNICTVEKKIMFKVPE